jgi:putative oxidoreductase
MEIPMEYAARAPRNAAPAIALASGAVNGLNAFASLLDLAIRLWVASIFFKAGLTKIASWDSTLALFENEYAVPLLPPELAAYLGTGAELILPVFLAIGLLSRPAALALFVFNIVAVISYPDISPAGVSDHTHWGFLLAVTLFHGPGKISLDHFIRRRFVG